MHLFTSSDSNKKNNKFQTLVDLVKAFSNIAEDDKIALLDAVKSIEKTVAVLEFKVSRTEKEKKTLTILLEETIGELENKRKAIEIQNRELEIEAALERVRSKTMAMHRSSELEHVIKEATNQLEHLGFRIHASNFNINLNIHDNPEMHLWVGATGEKGYFKKVVIPYLEHPMFTRTYEAIKMGEELVTDNFSFEEKNRFYEHVYQHTALKDVPEERKNYVLNAPGMARSTVIARNSGLTVMNFDGIPYTNEENGILHRMAHVFDQAYTRFLDLQKAEAQAKEAQIEVALERVRAQAMAMHISDDLRLAVATVFEELDKLNLGLIRCGIAILDKEKPKSDIWISVKSDEGRVIQVAGGEPLDIHPLLQGTYDAWRKQEDFSYVLQADDLHSYYQAITHNNFQQPIFASLNTENKDLQQYYFNAVFQDGSLFAFLDTAFTDEARMIMKRFANVFNLTYKRFLDLQKAEAQTREAKIEAALERVRSRTMAMQKSEELAETAHVLFQEFQKLGQTADQITIGIINENEKVIEFWLTIGEKHIDHMVKAPIDEPIVMQKLYSGWKQQKTSFLIELAGKELHDYLRFRNSLSEIHMHPTERPDRKFIYAAFFSMGFLTFSKNHICSEDTSQLLQRFAGVFDLTYTRFLDLKQAEAMAAKAEHDLILLKQEKKRTEDALTELRATQAQLIQSEKMASLGELTAGIAHEIQNPLNFVTNFSEVSIELTNELEIEVNRNNQDEILAIAEDLKGNLAKIHEHGKRASSIVKGMLQHSRKSTGTKEPTDINALADEYLRLSYHGLRAKDKTFNATIEADFDESVGNIEIIPQDIGRVLLNLLNNAFYSVNEKKKTFLANPGVNEYEPAVSISTKREDHNVIIKVCDNGTGIPEKVLNKIYQPFYTTKPTGEGTGLGLSLSYEIITKGHGGDIKVESRDGEGATFIITLPVKV